MPPIADYHGFVRYNDLLPRDGWSACIWSTNQPPHPAVAVDLPPVDPATLIRRD